MSPLLSIRGLSRLETRGKHPLFDNMLQDYLEAMQIETAEAVFAGARVQ